MVLLEPLNLISGFTIIIFCQTNFSQVYLPGMQPAEANIEFVKVQQCQMCHAQTKNGAADPTNTVRGPYGDGTGPMPHKKVKSDFHASSKLCAVCHNVSNPLFANDVKKDPPYSFGAIERTYSEWALSDFAQPDNLQTCQSCHYPPVLEGGQASRFGDLHRDYFVFHGPVGGSTWVQDVTYSLWQGQEMDRPALDQGKKRSANLLKKAASLSLEGSDPESIKLRITNLTGHKLPTGYPEGRRMWLNVRFLDSNEDLIRQIGRYDMTKTTLQEKSVEVPTLLDPHQTKVYECLPALSEAQAKKHDIEPGPSFHFVLNDIIALDNRIPPQGFDREKFAEHQCEPIGANYADGQYWDETGLTLPEGCSKVIIRLMYQSISWEYIKFLIEGNTTDSWGRRLYEAWTNIGYCPPTVMTELTYELKKIP